MAEKTLYKLSEVVEGNTNWTEVFSEKALIKFFKEDKWDLFEWILDNEPERELPDFSGVTTIRELGSILDEYNYSWYELKIEPFTGVQIVHTMQEKRGSQWKTTRIYPVDFITLDNFINSFVKERWNGERRYGKCCTLLGYFHTKTVLNNPYAQERSVREFTFYKDGERA